MYPLSCKCQWHPLYCVHYIANFQSVSVIAGRPLQSSSFRSKLPALNILNQLRTVLIVVVPISSVVSLALLPFFKVMPQMLLLAILTERCRKKRLCHPKQPRDKPARLYKNSQLESFIAWHGRNLWNNLNTSQNNKNLLKQFYFLLNSIRYENLSFI